MAGLTENPMGTWNLSYGKTCPRAAMQPLSDWDQGAWGEVIIEWFGLDGTSKDHLIHPVPAQDRDIFH